MAPTTMAEWLYFIHPPREDFAATMTGEEEAVWSIHFERFERLLAEGVLILVGPTLGRYNTGIARRTRSSRAGSPAASCARSGSRSCAAATADGWFRG